MLFQFETAALLGDSDTEGRREGGWGDGEVGEQTRGKEDGRLEHLLVIPFHIPYGFITIMRERRLQSV